MTGTSRLDASAAVGGLVLLCVRASRARAAASARRRRWSRDWLASLPPGTIQGVGAGRSGRAGGRRHGVGARRDHGVRGHRPHGPLRAADAVRRVRISFAPTSAGSSRRAAQIVEVRAERAARSSSIALRRVSAVGRSPPRRCRPASDRSRRRTRPRSLRPHRPTADRRPRRRDRRRRTGVAPPSRPAQHPEGRQQVLVAGDADVGPSGFGRPHVFGRAMDRRRALATNFFTDTPFSGQVNLLTTSSFDAPQQLFAPTSFRAERRVSASWARRPANADWTVRGALTQGDIASWIVVGRLRHATRRRRGIGTTSACRTARSATTAATSLRCATSPTAAATSATLYGFDTFAVSPAVIVTYGARYARYDYLEGSSLSARASS